MLNSISVHRLAYLLWIPLAAQTFAPDLSGLRWRMIGPFRGGRPSRGRDRRPAERLLHRRNNGGVWKTDDFGRTWNPIFDDQPTGSIGAVAVAPSDPNMIYVGSGEGLQRPDLSVGDGMYKSTDAGKTWRHLGLRDGQQISADHRRPAQSRTASSSPCSAIPTAPTPSAASSAPPTAAQTLQKVLYKDENTGARRPRLRSAQRANRLRGAVGRRSRGPGRTARSAGPNSGLFKSTDGGDHLEPAHRRPAHLRAGRAGPHRHRRSRPATRTACTPWSRRAAGRRPVPLRRRRRHLEARQQRAAASTAAAAISPACASTPRTATRSTSPTLPPTAPPTPAKTFTAIKGAPGGDDYHTIWINPDNPNIILLASDQGATISVNGGATWSSWYNQPTAQFYHVITDNQFPYWVYGGQQESGSAGIASRGNDGEITFRDWHPVGVEEYGYVAPDPLNPNIIYGGREGDALRTASPAKCSTWPVRRRRGGNVSLSCAPCRCSSRQSIRTCSISDANVAVRRPTDGGHTLGGHQPRSFARHL